jgi:uncharacterized protein
LPVGKAVRQHSVREFASVLDPVSLAGFILVTAIAAYAQTLTGFAFGLILMGAVGITGILPIPEAAVFVSVFALVNALQMMRQGWRHVAPRIFGLILMASLPAQVVGYHLLGHLATNYIGALKLTLGAIVMLSSLQLLAKPAPLPQRSSDVSFLGFGMLAGLMSGLFSTSGPPLVYHLYRQPLSQVTVRETLVSTFAISSMLRLSQVALAGNMPPVGHLSALLAIPAVMAATFAARRWPPALSTETLRRIVFCLLFLSGVSLAGPVIWHWLAGLA